MSGVIAGPEPAGSAVQAGPLARAREAREAMTRDLMNMFVEVLRYVIK